MKKAELYSRHFHAFLCVLGLYNRAPCFVLQCPREQEVLYPPQGCYKS